MTKKLKTELFPDSFTAILDDKNAKSSVLPTNKEIHDLNVDKHLEISVETPEKYNITDHILEDGLFFYVDFPFIHVKNIMKTFVN